jgi:hypothetical protein
MRPEFFPISHLGLLPPIQHMATAEVTGLMARRAMGPTQLTPDRAMAMAQHLTQLMVPQATAMAQDRTPTL